MSSRQAKLKKKNPNKFTLMSEIDKIQKLSERIGLIEERNSRVEADKAWESSWARKILLSLFTYLSIALYFQYILQADPWLNAIVPTAGFLLSTLTLTYFKKLWLRCVVKNDGDENPSNLL